MASNDEQRSATTILTTAAQSIAARLIANETTAKFTKAEISTTNLFNQSVTELQVLTSLDNVQQTADINTVTVINNNTVNVNVAIDQTKAPNNYQMNSVGLFAVDGDGKEVLYSVTVLKDPVYIHQDAMGSALGIDLETVVGQASNVEISVNPAGAVTNEILKATLADYVKTDDVKSLIPATVIDGSKPADFKESVTLEKGAVDGTGNAIATTKNLADGDAQTLTSAKAYADTKVSGKADDSKVVHDNHDGTEQLNGVQVQPFNKLTDTIGGRNLLLRTSSTEVINSTWNNIIYVDVTKLIGVTLTYSCILDITQAARGSVSVFLAAQDSSGNAIGNTSSSNSIAYGHSGRVIVTITVPSGASKLSINERTHHTDVNPYVGSRQLEKGSIATDYRPAPEDKVNVADMRKPANDVAGIEEVNAKQDKLTITPADDSKVAHLSGANNFDTVPTVNNNPLLLASSLPSDLARTSQQANFTGKLQKSGVDVATVDDVSAKQDKLDYTPANDANTFHRSPDTGAVTESGNFPGLQVKGVDVATAADLKSVEESAWREITNPAFQGSYLFRDNEDGTASLAGTIYFYNRSQQYNENDDYIVPMPDGYKATGVASEGSLMGFINDFSVSLQGLKAYFPGTALHLYTDLNQNRPLSIPLCSIISSSATGITSSPIVLKVVKTS
ncbi:hypothetical protein OUY26_05325 [Levilactobacillus brevis]|uniref:hypothetical protein n=1 Tax=Levilactobacillus brevis TaxID=1580 RepID=UPI0022787334|nr:hypothetical protein [Levilactobacillus brevis]WAE46000.1 hypothetical protein OUY26_05325 [Levilactobacillus brevis]